MNDHGELLGPHNLNFPATATAESRSQNRRHGPHITENKRCSRAPQSRHTGRARHRRNYVPRSHHSRFRFHHLCSELHRHSRSYQRRLARPFLRSKPHKTKAAITRGLSAKGQLFLAKTPSVGPICFVRFSLGTNGFCPLPYKPRAGALR